MKSNTRNAFKVSSAFLALLLLTSIAATPAAHSAEKGYRYWGYFHASSGANSWTASMTGAAVKVSDGDVEGWAFTWGDEDTLDPTPPRVAPDFKKLCAKTKAIAGKKRIGIYIDFGSISLRPKGEVRPKNISSCVVTDRESLGFDVLGAVAKIRADSGFVCGINNYPAKECSEYITPPLKYRAKK